MRAFQGIGETPDRLSRAIIAGFVATGVMTSTFFAAYYLATIFGRPDGGLFARWLWGLVNNEVISTSRSLIYEAVGVHLALGLMFALIYAYVFEPLLLGRPWLRGVTFSLLPWLLSVLVLLPLLGGGFFGVRLPAGPLPAIGNLILHLAYGAALGWTYGLGTVWREDVGTPMAEAQATWAEHTLAVGIVTGGIVGTVVGWLLGALVAPLLYPVAAPGTLAEFVLAGALFGAASGAIIGPMAGLGTRTTPR